MTRDDVEQEMSAMADQYEQMTGRRPNRFITRNEDVASVAESMGLKRIHDEETDS